MDLNGCGMIPCPFLGGSLAAIRMEGHPSLPRDFKGKSRNQHIMKLGVEQLADGRHGGSGAQPVRAGGADAPEWT